MAPAGAALMPRSQTCTRDDFACVQQYKRETEAQHGTVTYYDPSDPEDTDHDIEYDTTQVVFSALRASAFRFGCACWWPRSRNWLAHP